METNETLQPALWQEAEQVIQTLVATLSAPTPRDLKHFEQVVMQAVWTLGRHWLAVVLKHSTTHQPAPARRAGRCGHHQRLVGWRAKELLTLLGPVEWSRPYYQCLLTPTTHEAPPSEIHEVPSADDPPQGCGHGEAPADELLGVQGRRTSAGVQEVVSYLAAQVTLQEAAAIFTRLLPLSISARQVLALIRPVGEHLGAQEDEQVTRLWQEAAHSQTTADQTPAAHEPIERLYVELDGVLARLRRGSVPLQEPEQQREGDVYREVKVGAVFPATRGPERSGLAPGVWVDEPCQGSIRYVARRTAKGNFGALLYALAHQEGLERAQQVVVLGDGAPWIWRLAEEHFPGAVQVVDLWHAQEHVWEVAQAAFGRGTPASTAWAKQGCSLLIHGQIEALVAAIGALPPVSPLPGYTRSVPEQAIGYFLANAERMRYPFFRAQGLHVGSGIAEAACKTVVSTRAKRAGMRWTPEGLDTLLPLRTAVLNGTYNVFWRHQSAVLT